MATPTASTRNHTSTEQAESLIRATGARLTQPRVRVLAFLLAQHEPLTHHDILARLPGEGFDAVTLYRVLEWLTEQGLAHRIAGADQVWRFSANPDKDAHDHAHFQCTRCEAVTCVPDVPLPRKLKLPDGFTSDEVDVLIKGRCPRCAGE
ncbi:Fur family ferric uptake transcriptional regulator [Pseudoduganella flava]|uniref:Fur family ferric uptake transcriptional regulator n=1 Tax=Pseudoduganella flava TaxID=871742 RepID=A0A562PJY4_9BURK|nr:Fur family transcriptional regulator [Pseudoduganella flava]QGZ42235.1 transcriptional repressor [Pseudoduganella flava]TWI44772.1 Fur family ferric uptake transcriptional regulator [Pseudoduganella flava]